MSTLDMLNAARVTAHGNRAPGTFDGGLKVISDRYVFPANVFSAADFLSLGYLPKGARVVDAGLCAPSLGTTGMFTLGTVADPDGFVGTLDVGGQAAVKKASTEALIGSQMADRTQVILDCSEATDAAIGLTLVAWVEYVMESIES
jgi:hypothetical protein